MEHETFGKIVAALRKEQVDPISGHSWSQQNLADKTGFTQRIVSKIERGRQAKLDGEILRKLASAFNLTSLERREFFAMASEVNDDEIVRTDSCDEEVFAQVWELLNDLRAPAFLMDAYGDIIGVNRAMLAFHNVSIARIQDMKGTSVSVNNLALLLDNGTPLRQMMGHAWQSIALVNVQQWRVMTLRYRHTPRYSQLFASLSAYPEFRMFWAAGNDPERAIDDCSRFRSYSYNHGTHGHVAYTVFVNTSLSIHGELYFSVLVPRNAPTSSLFQILVGDHNNAVSITPWPNSSLV